MIDYIESNKRIATFDGWYRNLENNKGSEINWYHNLYTPKFIGDLCIPAHPSFFKYHTSYEWLMLVVEKIESLGYISTIEKLSYGEHRVFFNNRETLQLIGNGARDMDKKTAIYLAVVNFIDCYNFNK